MQQPVRHSREHEKHDRPWERIIDVEPRRSIGLTQRALAARMTAGRRTLQAWEGGVKYPNAEGLRALIAALLERRTHERFCRALAVVPVVAGGPCLKLRRSRAVNSFGQMRSV